MNVTQLTLPRMLSGFFFFLSFSNHAAERLNLAHISFTHLQHKYPLTFSHYPVNETLPLSRDFLYLEHHYDARHTEHIRVQQQYRGFPVYGGYVIFHRKTGKGATVKTSMSGIMYQKLQEDLGNCPPKFIENAFQKLQSYRQSFAQDDIVDQSIQTIVFIDEHNTAHWAYQIQLYLQPNHQLPRRPTIIIAANTGNIFLEWDALATLHQSIHGIGFGGNRRLGKYQYGKDKPYLDLSRDEQSGLCFLENDQIKIVDMKHRMQHPNHPMTFSCIENHPQHLYWTGYFRDGYDKTNGSYSVSNDAMYFGDMIKTMYRDRYGVEVLQKNNQPMKLILRVHFSNYCANAFWDGQQLTFGDGDNEFHPPVTLSITAHELSHGFTQQHSGLQYHGQAGGINEAFSDMAAQAAEYYVYGKVTWQVGGDVSKTGVPMRWFDHPSQDGVSIERAIDYQNGMDVHYSSGVYNYLFYLLATHAGWNPHKAFQVMLKANRDYWTPTTNFAEGACGILAASQDLGFSQADVKDALDTVTINYSDC